MSLLIGLHPAGIAPRCEELFDKHGYAPLATFHAMEGGEAAFGEYGETMAAGLGEMVEQLKGVPGNSLSLWGHAVFLKLLRPCIGRWVAVRPRASLTQRRGEAWTPVCGFAGQIALLVTRLPF